ncbi:MAG TPA: ribosome biogenesis GTPase Der [Spirochaetota bacterium]|nr:ribosome biogenesis GTPase Der [Spirochaetota bacterium]HPI88564.1 ribosome biogenesis GTPase Der [Spirochaetota bacterium]HPR48205.1 ribosome biogenesis GTPase Der [Spirochaetota bacterium]
MAQKLPVVSIVGRQNVGKSTLFNALIKEKKAIVDSFPGLTRDILSYEVHYQSVSFTLSDTPGLDLPGSSDLSEPILANARTHLMKSSVIILLLENPAPSSFDLDLTDYLRKLSVPVIIVVNKMDSGKELENMVNFYETGYSDIVPISALNRFNLGLLLDKITELLPQKKTSAVEPDLNIAIVGRPNSGKSTLLNSFLGYERSVVSDIPGTTRDSVDEYFTFQKKIIRVIDTAGIRRKSKITENIEYYSLKRTIEAIERCDVVIHLLDANMGITENDKKISDEIIRAKKPIILAINKWDMVEKDHKTFDHFRDKLVFKYFRADDFPIISISAKNKQRIHRVLSIALDLKEKASKKISTPELNRIIERLQKSGNNPQIGQGIKILYAAPIKSIPPRFKFFVNKAELFRKDIIRYFEKTLQRELDLQGIPIVIEIEGRKKRASSPKGPSGKKKGKKS